ncbi:MAG: hypothetical protein ABSF95_05920 [Verrucomicrobiota bacterium]
MKRPRFLTEIGAISSAIALRPIWVFGQEPPVDETVEKDDGLAQVGAKGLGVTVNPRRNPIVFYF